MSMNFYFKDKNKYNQIYIHFIVILIINYDNFLFNYKSLI